MLPGQIIGFFAGMLVIIFAAYYVTYYIGRKASGQSHGRLRNKNINMIDRFAIAKDKSFCIVEIAGKVYVVGVTNQTMTLLDTLDAAAFSEAAAVQNTEILRPTIPGGKYTAGLTKKLAEFIARLMGKTPPQADMGTRFESFSYSMKTAREKTPTEQTERQESGRKDNPEEL